MEYIGKLYGKLGSKFFDTGYTAADWNKLSKKETPLITKKLLKILDEENTMLKEKNKDLEIKLSNSLPNFGSNTIIDWEIGECIEELKCDWMSVSLIGKDNLGNVYNACGETFISNPEVDNITDIEIE